MAKTPWRKFIFLLVQLFFILKLYSWWQENTGLGLGPYLLVFFIVFWILMEILSKLQITENMSRHLQFRILSRFSHTDDWFGFLVVVSAALGFFVSRAVVGSLVMTYFFVFAGIILAYYFFNKGKNQNRLLGLLAVAFIFGIALGSRFTSDLAIVIIFVIANILLYFLSEAGS